MTPLTQFLSSVREKLEKATPGKWRIIEPGWAYLDDLVGCFPNVRNYGVAADSFADKMHGIATGGTERGNAELIASAPTDLALAIKIIEIQAKALLYYKDDECRHPDSRLGKNEKLRRDFCGSCSSWVYRGEKSIYDECQSQIDSLLNTDKSPLEGKDGG